MPRTCRPFWIGLQKTPSALAPRADRALLAERPPYLAASFFRSFRCGTNGLHGSRPLEQAWSSRRPSGATRPCPACWSPSPQAGGIPPLPCGTVLHRCRPWGPLKVHGRAGSNPGCHPDKAADRGGLTLSRLIATKGRRSTASSLDADEHHRGFAPRTGGALNWSRWNGGRQALRLGHECFPTIRRAKMRTGDGASMRRGDLKRELIRAPAEIANGNRQRLMTHRRRLRR
jgi:hypothetical protein